MTPAQARALLPGDEVRWNDPDEGRCSRTLKIRSLSVEDDGEGDAICRIGDSDGNYLQVYASELS